METIQIPINWSINKQNVVCPYKGILFVNKKEQNIDTCYNMDKPQKYYAKWKKPDAKDCIWYDSIYIKYSEKANL